MMKLCTKCEQTKECSEFNRNKARNDGIQSMCRICQAEYDKIYYRQRKGRKESVAKGNSRRRKETRQWITDLKRKMGCMKCAENHPACIEFHHRDSTSKEFNVSNAVSQGWGKEKILEEITKCDNLCANCHRKIHW